MKALSFRIKKLRYVQFTKFLSRLRSIATHRDHFVCLSVRLSHFPKLCWPYCINIGTLSNLIYIIHIAIVSISCIHHFPVIPRLHRSHRPHHYVDYIVSTLVHCCTSLTSCPIFYRVVQQESGILHDIDFNHKKCPLSCQPQSKFGTKWCAYIVSSQEHAHKALRSKQNLICKPVFS